MRVNNSAPTLHSQFHPPDQIKNAISEKGRKKKMASTKGTGKGGRRWSICFNYPDNCSPPQAIVTEMKQYSIGYSLGLFRRAPRRAQHTLGTE